METDEVMPWGLQGVKARSQSMDSAWAAKNCGENAFQDYFSDTGAIIWST